MVLSGLPHLTYLSFADAEYLPAAWRALKQLTGLQQLKLGNVTRECFAGIIQLTSCRQLSRIDLEIQEEDGTSDYTLYSQVSKRQHGVFCTRLVCVTCVRAAFILVC